VFSGELEFQVKCWPQLIETAQVARESRAESSPAAPEDEEMSKNTYPLKLPASMKKAAAELAAHDGVSLNQFIAAAVAEKSGLLARSG
jgi:predicted HicB family RNase H-like nuclease